MDQSTNQEIFYILRGYSDGKTFHSQGGSPVDLDSFLRMMNFASLNEFRKWYLSLTAEQIKEGKKDWCSGHCCQSSLEKMLQLTRNEKRI